MAKARKKSDSGANLGFEAKLWLAADKTRNNMGAAEYKHVVLGLIYLKYISDAVEEHRQQTEAGTAVAGLQDPEFLLSPRVVIQKVDALAMSILGRQERTVMESRTFAALRGALLPKLLSGQIGVPEAERLVGRRV